MNKWVAFTLFYLAVAVSLSNESMPWVRLAWLAPILVLWIASFAAVFWSAWKRHRTPGGAWQPPLALTAIVPKSWRDWIEGEGKYRAGPK